jgi:hypothetical protein
MGKRFETLLILRVSPEVDNLIEQMRTELEIRPSMPQTKPHVTDLGSAQEKDVMFRSGPLRMGSLPATLCGRDVELWRDFDELSRVALRSRATLL